METTYILVFIVWTIAIFMLGAWLGFVFGKLKEACNELKRCKRC